MLTTPKTQTLKPARWYHLAVTVEPDKQVTLYIDGNEAAFVKMKGTIPSPSTEIVIGASAKGGNIFTGDLDEVELSNIVRSASW